jgi:hypothetical protein
LSDEKSCDRAKLTRRDRFFLGEKESGRRVLTLHGPQPRNPQNLAAHNQIQPMLKQRFPLATDENLRKARAYAICRHERSDMDRAE